MKNLYRIFLIISFFFSVNSINAQLTADAGANKARCEADSIQIGGALPATGGTPPYTYSWETTYLMGGGILIFHANDFLNDTTLPNPIVVGGIDNMKRLTFKLTVTDALNNTDMDSMIVTFSQFVFLLSDNRAYINEGDSVQIGPNAIGGIPPLTYQWTPDYKLSNSTVVNPWASPDTTTSYICSLTDSAGCQVINGGGFKVYVTPVSIDEEFLDNNLKLYPNPSSNLLIIENVGNQNNNLTVEIRSVTGKLELVQSIGSFEKVTINTDQISSGIYFISIKDEHGIITTKKWVKQ